MLWPFRRKYQLEDVFTPTKAASLTYVRRSDLSNQLDRSLRKTGMQIVLYGYTGGGKTTFITNELRNLGLNYITTSCISTTSFADLVLLAFDKLGAYYTREQNETRTSSISSSLLSDYYLLKSRIESNSQESTSSKRDRVVGIQLTPQRLADFLGAANCLWIIEDFHKVDEKEKRKLSQVMKVFMDTANTYKNVRIICIGAVGTAREVVTYDKEMQNRVSEISIPLLDEEELEQIIYKGTNLLNVNFSQELQQRIVHYSKRLAAICHQLSFDICYDNKVSRTCEKKRFFSIDCIDGALDSYVRQNSDSFLGILDKALKQRKRKYENVKLILNALIGIDEEVVSFSQILTKIREKKPKYPSSNLSLYLKPLSTPDYNDILRYDNNANKYSFSNPFFKAFVSMYFRREQELSEKKREKRQKEGEELALIQRKIIRELLTERFAIETQELIKREPSVLKKRKLRNAYYGSRLERSLLFWKH